MEVEVEPPSPLSSFLSRTTCRLKGGHDLLPAFEEGRMYLRCQSCPYETPGWDLNGVPPIPFED